MIQKYFSIRFFLNALNYVSRVLENYLEYNSKPLGIILQVTPDTPEPKSTQNPKISGYRVDGPLYRPLLPQNSGGGIPVSAGGCLGRKVAYLRAQKELGGQPVHRYITCMLPAHLAPIKPTQDHSGGRQKQNSVLF